MEISREDSRIFDNDKVKEYAIDRIYMHYENDDYKDRVDIYLYNEERYRTSEIEIVSSNETWFTLMEKEFMEILSFCKKQSKMGLLLGNEIVGCVLVSVISMISSLAISNLINKIESLSGSVYIMIMGLFFFVMFILDMFIYKELAAAFPIVEIAITDKNNIASKKRKILFWLASTIVIPILLNLIYDGICYLL